MPVIQLQYPQGSLDAERKSRLASRLTEVMLQMEGGARTEGGIAFATVLFSEVPQGDWWTGGRTDERYLFRGEGQAVRRGRLSDGCRRAVAGRSRAKP
jgi:phenylpyruvate tautomerase PptA (4-oxalocrotonate tautomerase family)